jgi:deoxyadenosine/deoxycytidine kinase
MPRAFNGLGKARYAEITAQIFDYLTRVGRASRATILDKFYQDLDEYTLSIVMKTLVARKVVAQIYDPNRMDYIFEMKGGE